MAIVEDRQLGFRCLGLACLFATIEIYRVGKSKAAR